MSDLNPTRSIVQLQGTEFRSGVSESLMQSIGGNGNFNSYFQTIDLSFKLNGIIGGVSTPFIFDVLDPQPFNLQIIDAWMAIRTTGTSGTTTMDCLVSPAPGSGFVSIFTTKPSIAYNAVSPCWLGVVNPGLVGPAYAPGTYTPPANTTRPVLNPSVVNSIPAWSALQVELTAVAPGSQNVSLTLITRRIT